MSPGHKVFYDSREEAVDAGYVPCYRSSRGRPHDLAPPHGTGRALLRHPALHNSIPLCLAIYIDINSCPSKWESFFEFCKAFPSQTLLLTSTVEHFKRFTAYSIAKRTYCVTVVGHSIVVVVPN